ncbi:unnamed protein product [Rotaria sp. Silwood2]|nr:unnamed protein product [Rotaria sp. Silwood2]CAF2970367.1 unnamed protein product [Rotaria sp. Silwood2]CAF3343152.1 unnamed protein product [Rotaria sp. Silwood2]CAF4198663.1 unnamed protein product [Rotaria sp. Silwood2]CAF4239512.1 unnamed protein product [Rotaria sp. Silwood2]
MYKESLKYPEKVMLSFDYYQKIIRCLKQPKSGKTIGIDAKFYFWCKKHFKIDITSGIEILCSTKNGRRIVVIESYFAILNDIHKKNWTWRSKSIKLPVTPTAIISVGFLTRLQIDLIDFRTRPDKEFQWILHCRDHYSKCSWGYPLVSKEAQRVADHLSTLFYQFGPCKILQSDNGREFTASVIKNLKNVWPGLVIINGRPRHPENQGLVERGNSTLCQILGKFMEDRNTTSWTTWLLPAIYSMNTSLTRGVNMTPYEIVFGQKPRVDYKLWKLLDDQNITLEEDLSSSIRQRLAEDDTSESLSSNSTSPDNADQHETLSSIVTTNCIQNSVRLPISNATSDSAELPQAAQPTREPEPVQAADTLNNNNIETQQVD